MAQVVRPLDGVYFYVPDKEYPNRPLLALTDHESERARYWLLCADEPAEKVEQLHVRIRRPSHMSALGPGLLQSDTEVAGDATKKEAHWFLDYPCPTYLLCWAVGELFSRDMGTAGAAQLPLQVSECVI